MTLFGTGANWPSGIQDGTIAASAIPLDPQQNPFQVVDSRGAPASIIYSGTAPTLIYGVFQLNVQLPLNAASPFKLLPAPGASPSNAFQIYMQ